MPPVFSADSGGRQNVRTVGVPTCPNLPQVQFRSAGKTPPAAHAEHVHRFFFFFKQKTAYEISLGLVGSEMCIRDRPTANPLRVGQGQ